MIILTWASFTTFRPNSRSVLLCNVPNSNIQMEFVPLEINRATDNTDVVESFKAAFAQNIFVGRDFEAQMPKRFDAWEAELSSIFVRPVEEIEEFEVFLTYNMWFSALIGVRNFVFAYPGWDFNFEIFQRKGDSEDHLSGSGGLRTVK